MSHFTARPCLFFAVEMEVHPRMVQERLPIWRSVLPQITQQIDHDHRLEELCLSEWQPANRAHMLLELRGDTSAERIVPTIVDTRRNFIH